jgi:hypothetical protein
MVIVRLKPYLRACAAMGLVEANMRAIELHVAGAPDAHPMIRGLRGVRKARVALPGRGKRGGARVVYYLSVPRAVLFMLTAYPKNEQDDLTSNQRRAILLALESIKEVQS